MDMFKQTLKGMWINLSMIPLKSQSNHESGKSFSCKSFKYINKIAGDVTTLGQGGPELLKIVNYTPLSFKI